MSYYHKGMDWRLIDLTGKRFGKLEVLRRKGRDKSMRVLWECRCRCGNLKVVRGLNLRSGYTTSCGCDTRGHNWRHGQALTREYYTWKGMKNRCANPKYPKYKDYGGRGIKVCKRWMRFENFFADMGKKPLGMTIERINNDGNYEPGNCKWATPLEQVLNRRRWSAIKLSHQKARTIRRLVVEGMSKAAAARKFGVAESTISAVIKGTSWKEK